MTEIQPKNKEVISEAEANIFQYRGVVAKLVLRIGMAIGTIQRTHNYSEPSIKRTQNMMRELDRLRPRSQD